MTLPPATSILHICLPFLIFIKNYQKSKVINAIEIKMRRETYNHMTRTMALHIVDTMTKSEKASGHNIRILMKGKMGFIRY